MPELDQYAIPVFFSYGISLFLIAVLILLSYIQYRSANQKLQEIEED